MTFTQRRCSVRRGAGRVLALCVVSAVGLVGRTAPASADPPDTQGTTGTPLPAGWELCILEGVGAPATEDNVTDLDEWQVAEGGSTDNSAAYNPFNTRRMTDANGTALPATVSPNGFPAFQSWSAGCAATVATLDQPNMTAIVTALQAGNVAPSGAFLSDVDTSQWCAPSSDGTPCYADAILASKGQLPTATGAGDAMQLVAEARTALHSYNQDVSDLSTDETTIEAQSLQMDVLQDEVSIARQHVSAATRALRQAALDDYMTNRSEGNAVSLQPFVTPDERDILAQLYGNLATSLLSRRLESSQATFDAWVSQEDVLSTSIARTQSSVDSMRTAKEQALTQLNVALVAIKAAGACTATTVTPAGSSLNDSGDGDEVIVVDLTGCLSSLSQ